MKDYNKYSHYRRALSAANRAEQLRREAVRSFLSSPDGCAWAYHPQTDNMGVESSRGTRGAFGLAAAFRIDYLRLTFWGDFSDFQAAYVRYLGPHLGSWVDLEHGARFYKKTYGARLGSRLYAEPAQKSNRIDGDQVTIELPGKACSYLGFAVLRDFWVQLLACAVRLSSSRVDLAFDTDLFTVADFRAAVQTGDIRTYAKRETFRYIENPWEKRENGVEGCATVYIGTRESTRMVRVYDKHGPTRVELELHDEKATQVAYDLFGLDGASATLQRVYERSIGHLRDFLDLTMAFWEEFCQGIMRAFLKMRPSTQEIDAAAVADWLDRQVSSAFSVLVDVYGWERVTALLARGREKRENNKKYQMILSVGGAA